MIVTQLSPEDKEAAMVRVCESYRQEIIRLRADAKEFRRVLRRIRDAGQMLCNESRLPADLPSVVGWYQAKSEMWPLLYPGEGS